MTCEAGEAVHWPSLGAAPPRLWKKSALSCVYIVVPMEICRRLLIQAACCPLALAVARAGKSMPAKMAMMAMTTSNSMRVNPEWRDV